MGFVIRSNLPYQIVSDAIPIAAPNGTAFETELKDVFIPASKGKGSLKYK